MTTLESDDLLLPLPKRYGLLTGIWHALAEARLHRARRRALIHLSQYDAHMLRDIGIDPGDVAAAFDRRSLSVLFFPIRPAGRS